MKIKTSELIGPALDWAVAKCEGADGLRENPHRFDRRLIIRLAGRNVFMNCLNFSTDWSQGGPIIEREGINTLVHVTVNGVITEWKAGKDWPMSRFPYYTGPTPLIAAMRCYCCAKLGEFVDIPEELA